jgi:hypothetical protein
MHFTIYIILAFHRFNFKTFIVVRETWRVLAMERSEIQINIYENKMVI